MSTRRRIVDLLELDTDAFDDEVEPFLRRHDLETDRLNVPAAELSAAEGGPAIDGFDALSAHERDLVRRLWILSDAPLGITLAGPVYQDNPIIYATRTFRELTGYSLADVRGENLRLLQGPDTEPGPVDSLREALDIWTEVTVELWNYRADGRRFRNRVSLVPLSSETGMITNWVGLQERVEEP